MWACTHSNHSFAVFKLFVCTQTHWHPMLKPSLNLYPCRIRRKIFMCIWFELCGADCSLGNRCVKSRRCWIPYICINSFFVGPFILCDKIHKRNRSCDECRKSKSICRVSRLICPTTEIAYNVHYTRSYSLKYTFLNSAFVFFRATNMNEHSSRSHAIFIITIECSEVSNFRVTSLQWEQLI